MRLCKKYFICALVFSGAVFFGACLLFANHPKVSGTVIPPALQKFPTEPDDIDRQLGQNFIVGISGSVLDPGTKAFLLHVHPAGIVLYGQNISSKDQLKSFIQQLQVLAMQDTHRPYLIMIDEEPSGATRLRTFVNAFPDSEPDWSKMAQDAGDLAGLGVNVDLAPIADFPFVENAYVADRVPASSVSELIDFNQKFIQVLHAAGIAATLKHFPGLGFFANDPHLMLPTTSVSPQTMDLSFSIFQAGINDGADFVMPAHGIYEYLDPVNPATLSSKIITDTLRQKLGFNGIVVTDDLSAMPFIPGGDMSLASATVAALVAGNNLLMFSHDPAQTQVLYDTLLERVETDPDLRALAVQNYNRIVSYKNAH